MILIASCAAPPAGDARTLSFSRFLALDAEDLPGERPPEANLGLALGDLDGDGLLDLLVLSPEGSVALHGAADALEQDGLLRFDGGPPPAATGGALADVDGDGDLDLWQGDRAGRPDRLWRNDGAGQFRAEALAEGEGESTSGSFADVDGDGDLDLFVARYAPALDPAQILDGTLRGDGNLLYRNEGGALVPDPEALPEEVRDDLTFLGQWIDVEPDGDADLYLANDYGPWLGRNRLLRNDGAGHLTLDDGCACDRAMFAMGAAVGDPDADGDADLFLTDLAGPDLLLNAGDGGFYDAGAALGATVPRDDAHLASWGTAFVDLDGDGWEDLPMVFGPLFPAGDPNTLAVLGEDYADWYDGAGQRDVLLRNLGGTFEDQSTATGFDDDGVGRALAVGDIDRDGQPDLVIAGLWYVQVLLTRGGDPGLRVQPGPASLAGWPGARVEAEYADRTLTRFVTPATTWSSNAPELIVPADPLTVRITWPDGHTSTHTPDGPTLELP